MNLLRYRVGAHPKVDVDSKSDWVDVNQWHVFCCNKSRGFFI